MTVKLLTEQNFVFLSLTGGGTGSSEYTVVKMPHCWKSRVAAQLSNRWCLLCESFTCLYSWKGLTNTFMNHLT